MEQLALTWGPTRTTYTVAQLSARIRDLLGSEFDDIWVAGEISGVRTVSSGHCYFTLKDQNAQIRCACFRASLRYLKFKPQDGVAVLARGHIDLYEARGEYQLLVEALEPQGHGALQPGLHDPLALALSQLDGEHLGRTARIIFIKLPCLGEGLLGGGKPLAE